MKAWPKRTCTMFHHRLLGELWPTWACVAARRMYGKLFPWKFGCHKEFPFLISSLPKRLQWLKFHVCPFVLLSHFFLVTGKDIASDVRVTVRLEVWKISVEKNVALDLAFGSQDPPEADIETQSLRGRGRGRGLGRGRGRKEETQRGEGFGEDGSFHAKLSETFSFKMHFLFLDLENYPLCHINTPRWWKMLFCLHMDMHQNINS